MHACASVYVYLRSSACRTFNLHLERKMHPDAEIYLCLNRLEVSWEYIETGKSGLSWHVNKLNFSDIYVGCNRTVRLGSVHEFLNVVSGVQRRYVVFF